MYKGTPGLPRLLSCDEKGYVQSQEETRLCHEDAESFDSSSCICVPKKCSSPDQTPQQPLHCRPSLKHWAWEGAQLCAQALLPSCMEPGGTCLVGGVLVDDADVLAVREPQESEILGSFQVVPKVIKDL